MALTPYTASPAELTTFTSLASLPPKTREAGMTVSGRDWIIDVSDPGAPTVLEREGEIHLNEYDALDEVGHFLDMARAVYVAAGRTDCAAEVDRFAKDVRYLDSDAFKHATETIGEQWAERLNSGIKFAAALPSAHDAKDSGVASSEYILAHVLEIVRRKCGTAAVKKILLVPPGAEITQDIRDCETIEYLDDWCITGDQIRRTIKSYPKELQEKIRVQLLVRRGSDRSIDLGDGTHIPLSGVYELPQCDDVHAGPSTIAAHSTVNYGWQNRLLQFGLDIAAASPQHQAVLPLMIHLDSPYRTRRDKPSFFKQIGAYATLQLPLTEQH